MKLLPLFLLLTVTLTAQIPELIIPASHTRPLMHLASNTGGGMIASASIDETVKIWDTQSGRELHTYRPGVLSRDLSFSPDDAYLAIAAFTNVIVLRTSDWQEVARYPGWNVHGVRFHPQRNVLYYFTQRNSSTGEDPLQVFAVQLPQGQPRLLTKVNRTTANELVPLLDISPDGQYLLIDQAGPDNVRIDTRTGSTIPAPYVRRFTPSGNLVQLETFSTKIVLRLQLPDGSTRWQQDLTPKYVTRLGLRHSMAFHEDRYYWMSHEGVLIYGSLSSNDLKAQNMPDINGYAVTTAGNYLYLEQESPFQIKSYSLPQLLPGLALGEVVMTPYHLAGNEQPARLNWGKTSLSGLRFESDRVVVSRELDGTYSTGRAVFAEAGNLLATAGSSSNNIFAYRHMERDERPHRFKSGFKNALVVATQADGDAVAVVASDGYMVINTRSDKFTYKAGLQQNDARFQEHAALSPDGQSLLLNVSRYTGTGQQTKSYGRMITLNGGATRWEVPEKLENPAFSPDGKQLAAEIYQNLSIYNATTGAVIRRHPLPQGRFPYRLTFNRAINRAVYTHDDRAYVYELGTHREHRLQVPGQDIPYLHGVFVGEDFAAFAGKEGVLRVFDLRTRQYVGALLRYDDSDDWAFVAPDGRFEATPGAMKKMYYRVNNQLVALEQLFGGYYMPGLASAVFNRQSLSDLPPAPDLRDLHPVPDVDIEFYEGSQRNLNVEDDVPENQQRQQVYTTAPEASLVVKGLAPQDRVLEIRLYRNGKLLSPQATRNLIVEDDDPALNSNEVTYSLALKPGMNAFRAVAINSQLTESLPAYLSVNYQPTGTDTSTDVTPAPTRPDSSVGPAQTSLHLVTIGIDRYANPKYNLNYAIADAQAIDQTLSSRMRSLAGQVRQYHILDAQATQSGILQQLQTIIDQAAPSDFFVFYFAGHGIVPDQKKGDFYLVPYEVMSGEEVLSKGLSAATLQRISALVAAERQLFILDACQSGGALKRHGQAEVKSIAGLARTTGTHWLTATNSVQLATEFSSLGHGAFTYILLDALSGKADAASTLKDGNTTVLEIKNYLDLQLPILTKKYSGRPQYPSSYSYGQDFTLSR